MTTLRQRMQRASNLAGIRLVLSIAIIACLSLWFKPPDVLVALAGLAVMFQYGIAAIKLRCPKCGQSVLAGPGATRRLRIEPQCARCDFDFEIQDTMTTKPSPPA